MKALYKFAQAVKELGEAVEIVNEAIKQLRSAAPLKKEHPFKKYFK